MTKIKESDSLNNMHKRIVPKRIGEDAAVTKEQIVEFFNSNNLNASLVRYVSRTEQKRLQPSLTDKRKLLP